MALRKCPRCELNYIKPDEKFCVVCIREMKGAAEHDEDGLDICPVCGENPVLPGRDMCAHCLRDSKVLLPEEKAVNEDEPFLADVEEEIIDEIDGLEDMDESDVVPAEEEVVVDLEDLVVIVDNETTEDLGEIEEGFAVEEAGKDEENATPEEDDLP